MPKSTHSTDRTVPPTSLHLGIAAAAFSIFAIYGSWVPLNFVATDPADALNRFLQIPFLELGVRSRADWVANMLLFIPIGFFTMGGLCLDRKPFMSLAVLPLVFIGCIAFSIALEFSQMWFPNRTVSQNDIVAESLGGLIGAITWMVTGRPVVYWVRTFSRSSTSRGKFIWVLQAYAIGLILYSLLPFDITISIGELHEKYKVGRIVIWPFGAEYSSLFDFVYQISKDIIVFIPIGALIALGLFGPLERPRGILTATAIGIAFVAGVEFLQLLVFTRFADTTDIFTCSAGVLVGALATRHWYRDRLSTVPGQTRNQSRWMLWIGFALVYAVVLIIGFWLPFDFVLDTDSIRQRIDSFFQVPLRALYRGSEYKAASKLLQKLLLFAPLGALFARASWELQVPKQIRRIYTFLAATTCFGVAMTIELGQILSPRHTADITDVVICTIGATIGYFLVGHFYRSGDVR